MDHLDPVTKAKILVLTVAVRWGDEVAQNPDADNLLADDTADVAWLAYQALTALHAVAPERAEHLVRKAATGFEVSELAHAALDRVTPDPCWDHQPLRGDVLGVAA